MSKTPGLESGAYANSATRPRVVRPGRLPLQKRPGPDGVLSASMPRAPAPLPRPRAGQHGVLAAARAAQEDNTGKPDSAPPET